jgi:hypothetical protein
MFGDEVRWEILGIGRRRKGHFHDSRLRGIWGETTMRRRESSFFWLVVDEEGVEGRQEVRQTQLGDKGAIEMVERFGLWRRWFQRVFRDACRRCRTFGDFRDWNSICRSDRR